jgi:hypothetical protein
MYAAIPAARAEKVTEHRGLPRKSACIAIHVSSDMENLRGSTRARFASRLANAD